MVWRCIGHIIVDHLHTVSLSMSKTFIPGPLLSIILVTYCLTAKVTFILSTIFYCVYLTEIPTESLAFVNGD